MAAIPKILQPHINTAFPNDVCLVATVLPNGFAQVTPRGSALVFDDRHFSLWERGEGLDGRQSGRWHQGDDLLPQAAASCRWHPAQGWHRAFLRHREGA